MDVFVRESGPAAPAEAIRIAGQLAAALDAAAGAGIYHGLLHPRDVLVSADDVRITGLGIAQALAIVGYPAPIRRPYTAPERAGGLSAGRASDVYSLGALVFELLTSRRLSGSGEQAAAAVELSDGNTAAFQKALARALADKPEERFDDAAAFLEALRASLGGRGPAPRTPRKRRKPGDTPAVLPTPEPPAPAEELPLMMAFDREADTPATDAPSFEPPRPAVRIEPVFERVAPELALGSDVPIESVPADPDFDVAEMFAEETPQAPPDLKPFDLDEAPIARVAPDVEIAPVSRPLVRMTADQPGDMPLVRTESALERTRSALWPLVLALVVGVAIGFGLAMALLGRDHNDDGSIARGGEIVSPQTPPPTVIEEPTLRPPVEPGRASSPSPEPRAAASAAVPPPASVPPAQPATQPAPPAARQVPPATANRPAETRPAPLRNGRVTIRSTPRGARVTVDGKDSGVTPATIRSLAAGTYTIRIARAGYETEERRVSLTDARPTAALTVTLARAAAPAAAAPVASAPAATAATASRTTGTTGSLFVNSRPAGANVFVDGKLVGQTPFGMPEIAAGDHQVTMELDGYRRWASSVRIVSGQQGRVTGSLEK